MTTLGTYLQKKRDKAGLSQRAVAARIGVSQPTYALWEVDVHRPPIRHLRALAEVYGMSTREFSAACELASARPKDRTTTRRSKRARKPRAGRKPERERSTVEA